MNPYSMGVVRLGCFIGSYSTLANRTRDEWECHGYTEAHIEMILSTLTYFQRVEHLIFEPIEKVSE